MRVAIIHYWLVNMRGGEAVLDAMLELFPEADVYTHVLDRSVLSPRLQAAKIKTTFISRLPWAQRMYQRYLPFMPLALESLDLSDYDLVISSESGPAKGVLVPPHAAHICYCHTPMRYAWELQHEYLRPLGFLARMIARPLLHRLRQWDRLSAVGVDHFVANSWFVKTRIQRCYQRDAEVIHPPVDASRFQLSPERGDYYVVLSQLVGYKRTDLAVQAFTRLGKRLLVIGDGEERAALESMAGKSVEFLGRLSDQDVALHLSRCKALVFPGIEDFGIVPLEAMACGRPVIAYGAGGALETVVEGKTGLFFHEQTAEALAEAVRRFEVIEPGFSPAAIRAHAEGFDRTVFQRRFRDMVERVVQAHRASLAPPPRLPAPRPEMAAVENL